MADTPKKRFDKKEWGIRKHGDEEWQLFEAANMAGAKQWAQIQNVQIREIQKKKGREMYHHVIISSCEYEGVDINDTRVYSFRTKNIKIDDREPAAAPKPPRTPTKPAKAKVKRTPGKQSGYMYASYNRPLDYGMSLSQPYTIDFDRTNPAIAENQQYHSNREVLSIIIAEQPLSDWDIQHLQLVDIIAENNKGRLIEYIKTVDLPQSVRNSLVSTVEMGGSAIGNKADVDKYVRRYAPKRKPAPTPSIPPILTAPPELAGDGFGAGLTPTQAPKRKGKKAAKPKVKDKVKLLGKWGHIIEVRVDDVRIKPDGIGGAAVLIYMDMLHKVPYKPDPIAKMSFYWQVKPRTAAPSMPPILTAPPELAGDVLGGGMGVPPTAAPGRKPAARTTRKPKTTPAAPKPKKQPKKTAAAKPRKTTKKTAKPKAKKTAAGTKLTPSQREYLAIQGFVMVKRGGKYVRITR